MPAFENIAGQTFGRLTAIERATGYSRVYWKCVCECGNNATISSKSLKDGNTRSCGCLYMESRTKHGKSGSGSRAYNIWTAMCHRCRSTKHQYYAVRGITVCERWKTFENFFADMGEPPTPKHSIDRINNDGNYEPGNCRWATSRDQQRNTRHNRNIEHNGRKQCITAWAEEMGINPKTVFARITKGSSIKKALNLC